APGERFAQSWKPLVDTFKHRHISRTGYWLRWRRITSYLKVIPWRRTPPHRAKNPAPSSPGPARASGPPLPRHGAPRPRETAFGPHSPIACATATTGLRLSRDPAPLGSRWRLAPGSNPPLHA